MKSNKAKLREASRKAQRTQKLMQRSRQEAATPKEQQASVVVGSATLEDISYQISKLELRPGDYLIVQPKRGEMSVEHLIRIKDQLAKGIADKRIKVIVAARDLKFSKQSGDPVDWPPYATRALPLPRFG